MRLPGLAIFGHVQKGSPDRTRTYDKAVNSRLLYQLSYRGLRCRLMGFVKSANLVDRLGTDKIVNLFPAAFFVSALLLPSEMPANLFRMNALLPSMTANCLARAQ